MGWWEGWTQVGRALLAELLATLLLVWLGCTSCVLFRSFEKFECGIGQPDPALAFAFVVTANMIAFGLLSGAHMNPAVTLAAVLFGKMTPLRALGYFAAQMIGAVLGYAMVLATLPTTQTTGLCLTVPAPSLNPLRAVIIELGITFVLVAVVCGLWADPAGHDPTAPIKVGLVLAGLIYVAGRATGASMNPARSFGPALLQNTWRVHWVYWVGPMLGGALAALCMRFLLPPPGPEA